MLTSKELNKYKDKDLATLLKTATRWCHKYIRKRDEGKGCVSCDSPTFEDAGHFWSSGHFPATRYNEQNIHGQCSKCNRFLHGNGNEYRRRIASRITEQGLKDLDNTVDHYKRIGFKWDKISLIETIYYYKKKFKEIDY